MKSILILIHLAVCIALILIVLLQKGKGADMGVAFGGGGSQTVFGSSGATSFMQKFTTIMAIIFMLTSLGLTIFFGKAMTSSVMEGVNKSKVPVAQSTQAPAQTGQTQKKP